MQHVDSESPLPVGFVCEINRHEDTMEDPDIPEGTVVEIPPDFPPESFWLSKDAELDWYDRNAFLERKESTKGNFNSANLSPTVNPSHSNSSSQRYSVTPVSLKSKRPIIGLPKTQKTTYVDLKCRQYKPMNLRMFPKQSFAVGEAPPVTEPSSPKVSCIGRVRSKRCPSRRKESGQAVEPVKSKTQPSGSNKPQKSGLFARILSLFRFEGHRRRKNSKSSPEKVKKTAFGSRRICVTVKPVSSEPGTPAEPPALGGMIRFASGRRSDYLGSFKSDDVAGNHLWL